MKHGGMSSPPVGWTPLTNTTDKESNERANGQTDKEMRLFVRLSVAQGRVHGLWLIAIQPYVTLLCRFNGLHLRNSCKYMDTVLTLPTPEG